MTPPPPILIINLGARAQKICDILTSKKVRATNIQMTNFYGKLVSYIGKSRMNISGVIETFAGGA